jgi:hypothetical protein
VRHFGGVRHSVVGDVIRLPNIYNFYSIACTDKVIKV